MGWPHTSSAKQGSAGGSWENKAGQVLCLHSNQHFNENPPQQSLFSSSDAANSKAGSVQRLWEPRGQSSEGSFQVFSVGSAKGVSEWRNWLSCAEKQSFWWGVFAVGSLKKNLLIPHCPPKVTGRKKQFYVPNIHNQTFFPPPQFDENFKEYCNINSNLLGFFFPSTLTTSQLCKWSVSLFLGSNLQMN